MEERNSELDCSLVERCTNSICDGAYTKFNNSTCPPSPFSSNSCFFNDRLTSFNDLKVWIMPEIKGKRLKKINMDTTTAAAASATSEVIAVVNLASRDAKITAKLLSVSAKTC